MDYSVDIAADGGEQQNALAGRLTLGDVEYAFLLEAEKADTIHRALLREGAGALVRGLTSPVSSTPERVLEEAIKEANRAVHDGKMRNPAASNTLISAILCQLGPRTLYVAATGVAAPYFRTPGAVELLCEAENVATKLIRDGITSEITADEDADSRKPVNGLGTAPSIFEVHQTAKLVLPGRFELLLCGAGADQWLSPAHMDQLPLGGPVHDSAQRLQRIYKSKLKFGSAVLTLRPASSSLPMADEAVFKHDFSDRPSNIGRIIVGIGVLALLAVAGYAISQMFDGPFETTAPPTPVQHLGLPAGIQDVGTPKAARPDLLTTSNPEAIPTDTVAPGDVAKSSDIALPRPVDALEVQPQMADIVTEVQRRAQLEAEQAARRREERRQAARKARREARRKAARLEEQREKEREAQLAAAADVAGKPEIQEISDVTVQVMDFTKDAVAEEDIPVPFPAVKTDVMESPGAKDAASPDSSSQ